MSAASFEKNSLDWQLRLLRQQMGEWLERLFASNAPSSRVNPSLPSIPDWLSEGLFWLIVLLLASWAIWQLYRLVNPYFARSIFSQGRAIARSPSPEANLTVNDWLARSRVAQNQGNYREACRALYMAALQRLSDAEVIRNQPSRTDGEYLNLVQPLPKATAYSTLIRTHERLCFSDAPISSDAFTDCQQAYRDLETP